MTSFSPTLLTPKQNFRANYMFHECRKSLAANPFLTEEHENVDALIADFRNVLKSNTHVEWIVFTACFSNQYREFRQYRRTILGTSRPSSGASSSPFLECLIGHPHSTLAGIDFDVKCTHAKWIAQATISSMNKIRIPRTVSDSTNELPAARCLRELLLDDNYIGDEVAEAIAQILLHPSCSLKRLSLCQNIIAARGAKALGYAIRKQHDQQREQQQQHNGGSRPSPSLESSCSGSFSPLEKLLLNGNRIGPEGCTSFAKAMNNNNPCISIRVLYIGDNGVGDEGVQALAESGYPSATSKLQELSLGFNRITDAGFGYLTNALRRNCSVRELNIDANSITNDGIATFVDYVLRHANYTLETFDLDEDDSDSNGGEEESSYDDDDNDNNNNNDDDDRVGASSNQMRLIQSHLSRNSALQRYHQQTCQQLHPNMADIGTTEDSSCSKVISLALYPKIMETLQEKPGLLYDLLRNRAPPCLFQMAS